MLEADGGRGLTHRAVDRRAGLPQGSTSNYFKTREALLTAALAPPGRARAAVGAGDGGAGPRRPLRAAPRRPSWSPSWSAAGSTPERAGLALARYELFLEARRRPEFQLALDEVRREYLLLVEQLLPTAGCRDPHRHAPQLLALLDGLVLNQLLQPATELPDDGLVDQLERFFATC